MVVCLEDFTAAERKWFAQAIWKIIVVDGQVSPEEFIDLREAMNWTKKEEIEALNQAELEQLTKFPLPPLPGLSFEKAFYMLAEMIRVAAADSRLLLGELNLVEHFSNLLGFDERATEQALNWAEDLRKVNLAKIGLSQLCRDHFCPKA
ncbi:MAG: hypothetical protein RRB13_00820 [bacterium]|nr:hypothetical protein [bacterium]